MSRRPPARRPGSPRPKATHTCIFRVRMRGSPYAWMGTPPGGDDIWREIEVRADQTLGDLGEVIPGAFDLHDDHLWSFFLSGQAWDARTEYARTDVEGADGQRKRPADRLRIKDAPVGREFLFLFDYGEEWHFGVRLERTSDVEPHASYPRVVAVHGEPTSEDLEPVDDPFPTGAGLTGADPDEDGLSHAGLDFLDDGDLDDEEDERLADEAARLVEHFESWATVRGVAEQARIVARLVDYKLDVDQESPTSWTPEDLKDLLLEWSPEELVLEPGELELLLPSVRSFLTFLDHTGQLAPEGTRLAALEATLDWLAAKVGARMKDTSRFGPVKRAVTAMREAGVDPEDPDAVAEFLSRWELAEDDLPGEPPVLPPVRLAPAEELRAAAVRSTTVAQLTTLAEWVGEGGRKLTARGNLTVADGKELCALLGLATAERLAGERVRSANDLPGVALAVEWAKLTGLVRVRAGRLVPDPDNRQLLADPRELAGRALDTLTGLGDLALPVSVDAPSYAEDLEAAVLELLVLLYEGDEPVSLADFVVHVWEDHVLPELEEFEELEADLGDLGPDAERDDELELPRLTTAVNVMAVAGHLQQLGIIELEGDPDGVGGSVIEVADWGLEVGLPGIERDDAGDPVPELDAIQVRLTPLGVWKTNRLLRDSGAVAPVLGDLTGADAATLIDGCADYDEESCEEELRAWCAERGERAAAELAAYARDQAPDHERRMLALLALELAGPAAHAQVRTLLPDPNLRAHAQLWLVRNGAEDERVLDADATVWVLADVLAATLDADGPASMVEQLDELGPPELQLAALRDLEQAAHPRLPAVLEAVGRAHPDDDVARAARKAAFKLGPATSPDSSPDSPDPPQDGPRDEG